jgi:hypothetical protein
MAKSLLPSTERQLIAQKAKKHHLKADLENNKDNINKADESTGVNINSAGCWSGNTERVDLSRYKVINL